MSKQDLVSAAMLQLRAKIHESYAMLEAAVDAAPTESMPPRIDHFSPHRSSHARIDHRSPPRSYYLAGFA